METDVVEEENTVVVEEEDTVVVENEATVVVEEEDTGFFQSPNLLLKLNSLPSTSSILPC